jgi:hypothetical protein
MRTKSKKVSLARVSTRAISHHTKTPAPLPVMKKKLLRNIAMKLQTPPKCSRPPPSKCLVFGNFGPDFALDVFGIAFCFAFFFGCGNLLLVVVVFHLDVCCGG